MTSITFTLTGETSSLSSYFYPEIELDEKSEYSCCLLDLFTYNSIANINDKNNKFYYIIETEPYVEYIHTLNKDPYVMENSYELCHFVTIPVGSYEIDAIIDFLNKEFESKNVKIKIKVDKNTMKCSINSAHLIDFSQDDCIGTVLGFPKKMLPKGENKSDKLIDIQHINNIRIECDLVTGSFHNGKNTHTLYEFYPSIVVIHT